MVGVFDTAFHQTMPPEAYIYGLPYEYYEKYAVRRYGFHGTSHKYVSLRAAEILGKKPEDLRVVVCHLGNGSSISAVDGGKCVDILYGSYSIRGSCNGYTFSVYSPYLYPNSSLTKRTFLLSRLWIS